MSLNIEHIDEIFWEALQIEDAEQRDAYIRQNCSNDDQRLLVQKLIKAQPRVEQFLEKPFELDATAETYLLSETVGPYTIREEIGEGGFGVVYVAEQEQPIQRKVALKIIKPGMDCREVVARFEAERQALALMDHPNVARVLDAGTTDSDRPFFVMELVRGVPITDFCDSQQLTTAERLKVFIDVCKAVQHAHQKGVIHRDIKPNNVLVTLHDGNPVPKVIDFGVAKALRQKLTERTIYTSLGQMIGTPLYMSPEQAELSGLDIDTRSDVYSLGVLLYELLTGTTPFDNETLQKVGLDEMRRIIQETEPPKPSARVSTASGELRTTVCDRRRVDQRKLAQTLKGELDWIVMKALEKDRNRRYESPLAFSEDIRAYLAGNAVGACPPSIAYRFQKFVKKNKGKLATLSAVSSALCVGLIVVFYQRQVALDAKQLAEKRLEKVETQKTEIERLLYVADIRLAAQALHEGDPHQTKALLDRHRPTDSNTPDLRGVEWHYLMEQAQGVTKSTVISESALYTVCLSPDHQHLATAGAEGRIVVLNAYTLDEECSFDSHQIEVNGLCFSKNGERLLSSGDDGTIRLWDVATGQQSKSFSFGKEKAFSAFFTPDETHVIACGEANDVRIFTLDTLEMVGSLKAHTRSVEAIAISPDGRFVACASSDGTMSVWDWRNRRKVSHRQPNQRRLTCVKFSPDGKYVVYGSIGATVRLFSTRNWKAVRELNISNEIQTLSFSSDGASLAIGTRSGVIHYCPLKSLGQLEKAKRLTLYPHEGRIYDLLCIDDQSIVSVGQDGHLQRFNPTKKDVLQRKIPDVRGRHITISPDGKRVAWINETQIEIYDLENQQPTSASKFPREAPWSALQFSPDGRFLVAATMDGRLVQATGPAFQQIRIKPLSLRIEGTKLCFSADSKHLAVTARHENCVFVLRFPDLNESHIFPALDVQKAVLSAKGTFLAINRGRDLFMYNVETGQLLAESRLHHQESIHDLLFLSEQDKLITFANDKAVKIWNWRSSPVPELLGIHGAGLPISLAATSDGRTLFTAVRTGEVVVWNIPARQKLFPIAHSGSLAIAISNNDKSLVTVDGIESRVNRISLRQE